MFYILRGVKYIIGEINKYNLIVLFWIADLFFSTYQGKVLDETPPSFMVNVQEDQGLHKNESCCDQEVVIGVPTHYLNDGSCLYLLTPAISPPSVDTIKNWLSSGVGTVKSCPFTCMVTPFL